MIGQRGTKRCTNAMLLLLGWAGWARLAQAQVRSRVCSCW